MRTMPSDIRMPFDVSAEVSRGRSAFQKAEPRYAEPSMGGQQGRAILHAGAAASACRDPNSQIRTPYEPRPIVASHAPTIVEHGKSGRLGVRRGGGREEGRRGDDGEAGVWKGAGLGKQGEEAALERETWQQQASREVEPKVHDSAIHERSGAIVRCLADDSMMPKRPE